LQIAKGPLVTAGKMKSPKSKAPIMWRTLAAVGEKITDTSCDAYPFFNWKCPSFGTLSVGLLVQKGDDL